MNTWIMQLIIIFKQYQLLCFQVTSEMASLRAKRIKILQDMKSKSSCNICNIFIYSFQLWKNICLRLMCYIIYVIMHVYDNA